MTIATPAGSGGTDSPTPVSARLPGCAFTSLAAGRHAASLAHRNAGSGGRSKANDRRSAHGVPRIPGGADTATSSGCHFSGLTEERLSRKIKIRMLLGNAKETES